MEAYGQFAWKLRHYRAGPPASNHSSNGPVCRHLGGRLSGSPTTSFLASSSYRRPPFLLFSFSLLSSPAAFMEPRFRFHGPSLASRPRGSSDYGQRVSTTDQPGFIGGTGPACLLDPQEPLSRLGREGAVRPSSIDIFVPSSPSPFRPSNRFRSLRRSTKLRSPVIPLRLSADARGRPADLLYHAKIWNRQKPVPDSFDKGEEEGADDITGAGAGRTPFQPLLFSRRRNERKFSERPPSFIWGVD